METKWHAWMDGPVLCRDVDQAAQGARSLRLNLRDRPLPVAR